MSMKSDLPVAVIGAGPVGLAAAAHLLKRGVPVHLYEAGETVECSRSAREDSTAAAAIESFGRGVAWDATQHDDRTAAL
jgi:2-polyprenyl-6-methoxyphenol hydroxylase-like FAD-dependent oxidoreductase